MARPRRYLGVIERLDQAALIRKDVAEGNPRADVLRLQLQRPLIVRDAVLDLTEVDERASEVVVRLGIVGSQCDRLAIDPDSLFQEASLGSDIAEIVVVHGLLRPDLDGFL